MWSIMNFVELDTISFIGIELKRVIAPTILHAVITALKNFVNVSIPVFWQGDSLPPVPPEFVHRPSELQIASAMAVIVCLEFFFCFFECFNTLSSCVSYSVSFLNGDANSCLHSWNGFSVPKKIWNIVVDSRITKA